MKGKIEKIMTFLAVAGLMAIGAAVIVGLIVGVITGLVNISRYISGNLRPASVMAADVPAEGIGRAVVRRYGAFVCAGEAEVGLPTYTEGDGPAPEWYRPEEPMAAEWEDFNARQSDSNAIQRTDAGCPDWNLDSTIYGWDGRTMEAWEMDVFSRVMYLEFWGTSPECCEAGCDAILRLWESGYYGDTMYGVLSAETEVGGPVFETWEAVWGTTYDPDGLWEMRSLCEERFQSGPEWIAPFFRTGHYHEWAVPAYEIDGVYFSVPRG